MKLNKRACRKYAEPKWNMDLNNGLFSADQLQYLVRTVIKNVDHQRVLILYVYDKKQVAAGELCSRAVMSTSPWPAGRMGIPAGEAQSLTIWTGVTRLEKNVLSIPSVTKKGWCGSAKRSRKTALPLYTRCSTV